jgi:hypothetical protein
MPGLRDELLDGEIFYSLKEAKIVIESWRRHYNTLRPHGSLGYKARPGGLRARHGRPGCSATPTSSAVRAGGKAITPLTFQPDLSVGADHQGMKRL